MPAQTGVASCSAISSMYNTQGAHRKGEVALARLRQLLQEDRLHRHLQVLCIHVSIHDKHCTPTALCRA